MKLQFNFNTAYILENDFVKLSPLVFEHVEALAAISDDPEIWTYFLENGRGKEKLSIYIENALEHRKQGKEYPFVVYDKIRKAYAGMTRLYDIHMDLQTVKLGHTWYGKSFQGAGVNKNSKYLLFEFCFEKIKAVRVGFGAHIENKRSIHALQSIGCVQEGILRDFLPALEGKGRADIMLFSMVQQEWFTTVKQRLKQKISA